ncbi:MAG: glycosyl hydrolase [Phycisphaerae bacterium]
MSLTQLENEFINPSSPFRSKPFWAWNDQLEESELRRQIRIFKAMGLGGFFMHSRVGLKTPYLSEEWFKLVKDCIDEAEKTGTEAWLYDEDRWPSGAAGGLVTCDPQFQAKLLVMSRYTHPERFNWPKNEAAYVYGATFEDEKITWYKKLDQTADIQILPQGAEILKFSLQNTQPSPWYNNFTYLDTLSPQAVEKFIDVTHEAYRRTVGEHFGKRVPGIFTDEPNGGWVLRNHSMGQGLGLPWTTQFPNRFGELFDYDILQHLPEIMFDLVNQPFSQARYHYYCCKTRLFAESFMKQIGAWCEKNNLLCTGHVLEEEPITHCVSVVGAAMQCYPYMQAPGIDILTQYNLAYITTKQCVSVARQTGRKWVLSELYGCTGWDTKFEAYKHSGDWQAALGITLRCPHLSWYSMAGEAKRDYPASFHFHSPWWKQYKFVEDYFSRLNVVLSAGEPVCDLAVIHPVESYYLVYGPTWETDSRLKKMDKDNNDLVCWLLGGHLDFDFADEHLLVEFSATVDSDQTGPFLQIGKMKYRAVLVPPMITLRKTTLEILRKFDQAGGKVVFADSPAQLLDAKPSSEIKTFAEGKIAPFSASEIIDALGDKARKVSIRDPQNQEVKDIFYQLRKVDEDWALFLVNTNRQTGFEQLTIKIQLELPKGGQIQLWDAASGEKYKLTGELTYRSAGFKIDIPASGSRLVVISSQPVVLPLLPTLKPTGQKMTIGTEGWSFLLDDYNVAVLDRPDCQAHAEGKKKFAKTKVEILQLDRDLREYLGLELRGGAMTQPWTDKDKPLGPTTPVTLTYRFGVKAIPTGPILLALEQPQRWQIKINGQKIDSDMISGWWVDPAIKTIMVEPSLLVRGKNFLTLEGQFDRLTNLETIFLLGNFGVETDGKNATLTKFPVRFDLGSWRDEGLPFYCGNVTYRTTFDFQPDTKLKYLLTLPKFEGAAAEITLNGAVLPLVAWPDYQIDCTNSLQAGKNAIDIRILGSRRNGFGPLHLATDKPSSIGPYSYIGNPENPQDWQDEYKLIDYGLYEPPVIITCET